MNITLCEAQAEKVNLLEQLYTRTIVNAEDCRVLLDTSKVGSGKMVTTFELAKRLGLKLLVFSPQSALDAWNQLGFEPNLLINTYSYSLLRQKTTNNQWLSYDESTNTFQPTQNFVKAIDAGCIVVFDEAHLLQGMSQLSQAACTLLYFIGRGKSFGLLLSGSMLLSNACCVHLKLFGYIAPHVRRLHDVSTTKLVENGCMVSGTMVNTKTLQEALNNVMAKKSVCQSNTLSNQTQASHISLLVRTHCPRLSNACKAIQDSIVLDSMNQNQTVPENDDDDDQHQLNVNEPMKTIEDLLVPYLVQETLTWLVAEEANCKVIIFVLMRSTIEQLAKCFVGRVGCRLLTGDFTPRQRSNTIDLFQQTNNECRVLLCTYAVAAHNISLQDKHGGYPRVVLATPCPNKVYAYQMQARAYRFGVMSPVRIFTFYPVHAEHTPTQYPLLMQLLEQVDRSDPIRDDLNIVTKRQLLFAQIPDDALLQSWTHQVEPFPKILQDYIRKLSTVRTDCVVGDDADINLPFIS